MGYSTSLLTRSNLFMSTNSASTYEQGNTCIHEEKIYTCRKFRAQLAPKAVGSQQPSFSTWPRHDVGLSIDHGVRGTPRSI